MSDLRRTEAVEPKEPEPIVGSAEPELCPFCDSTIAAEPVGAGRFWCGCCARIFHVSAADRPSRRETLTTNPRRPQP